jgi:CheY-like chemotaxis protein
MSSFVESHKSCILVIDDSPEMLTLDRIVLESAGYRVFTSSCGEEAMSLIDKLTNLKLILLDYNLPDMNGSEFLLMFENIKPEIFKTVPVVYHSGMDYLEKGRAAGIIPKVTDIKIFLGEIQRYIQNSSH